MADLAVILLFRGSGFSMRPPAGEIPARLVASQPDDYRFDAGFSRTRQIVITRRGV
jgi:hypothetical protein